MITTTQKALTVALTLQAGLAAFTWWPGGDDVAAPTRRVVDLALDAVQAIAITGRPTDGNVPEPLRLVREGDRWTLPSLHGYPADREKVEEMLAKLLALEVRAPIATQRTSHAALEVADTAFTRRVVLETSAGLRDVYLGAASGESMHVRFAEEDEVFVARGATAWTISDSARRYLPSLVVNVAPDTVTRLEIRGPEVQLVLDRNQDGWTHAGDPDQSLDADAVDTLLDSALNVRLDEPVGTQRTPAHGFDAGTRVLWTARDGDQPVTGGYTIGAIADGRAFVVVDGDPHVLKVYLTSVKPALDVSLPSLMPQPDPILDD